MVISTSSLEKEFEKVLEPFHHFIKDQTTSSMVLISFTILALVIANSQYYHTYEALLHLPLGVFLGDFSFSMNIKHWINEGFMTLFFFLLGMEIKREILVGEMKDKKRLIPVIAAAFGGMVVPAIIFYFLNADTDYVKGWGIPMATDTAFAVGILALLGNRIPSAIFAFLTALAIIDDLGAILVIAFFYSDTINFTPLAFAATIMVALITCNLLGIRRPFIYFIGGVMLWLCMLGSGIHSTVAGILVAATIPARTARDPVWFVLKVKNLLKRFEKMEKNRDDTNPILGESAQHSVVEEVEKAAEKTTAPLRRWEKYLEHPVSLFVIPIFALTNAGIPIDVGTLPELIDNTLAMGIILGLVLGKGIGIPLMAWLTIHFKLGCLPPNVNIQHIIGLGLLGGMGFTMSIFVSNLGFENNPETLLTAKMGIIVASLIAGLSGYLWLRLKSSRV